MQNQKRVKNMAFPQRGVNFSAKKIPQAVAMGGGQESDTAAECLNQCPAVLRRGDFIHGNDVRPHGPQGAFYSRSLWTAAEDIHFPPGLKAGRKQFLAFIYDADCFGVREFSRDVPKQCGFSPAGSAEDQNGLTVIVVLPGNAGKIPGHPNAKGG